MELAEQNVNKCLGLVFGCLICGCLMEICGEALETHGP